MLKLWVQQRAEQYVIYGENAFQEVTDLTQECL